MKQNVIAPRVGESITEVSILKWHRKSGEAVKKGDLILEIESDKATVEIIAEASGVLTTLRTVGERIPVGEVIGVIDDSIAATTSSSSAPASVSPTITPAAAAPVTPSGATPGPAARKILTETGIDPSTVSGTGKDGRITKGDLLNQPAQHQSAQPAQPAAKAPAPSSALSAKLPDHPNDRRVPMTMLRARIAERLVQAQHTAAILTTFNEVDMNPVMALRNQHKDAFKTKNGVALSFMSFFTKAAVEALKAIPEVNASIDGNDVVYHDYYDIGIAVGTDRGLVVPVLRGADGLTFVQIEKKITELAERARGGKLSIQDMSGGTFTISNGGVYGSLFSTPILNPPQSGILGMHKIQERPVVVNGKIEARPMMYLALSYDHRIIDGKGAVTFLVVLKDFLENPTKLKLDFI